MLIGTSMRSVEWCHFQWPCTNPNSVFKVTQFFNTEYVTNGYIYGHIYNRKRIENRTQAFEWRAPMTLSDLTHISRSRGYYRCAQRIVCAVICLRPLSSCYNIWSTIYWVNLQHSNYWFIRRSYRIWGVTQNRVHQIQMPVRDVAAPRQRLIDTWNGLSHCIMDGAIDWLLKTSGRKHFEQTCCNIWAVQMYKLVVRLNWVFFTLCNDNV